MAGHGTVRTGIRKVKDGLTMTSEPETFRIRYVDGHGTGRNGGRKVGVGHRFVVITGNRLNMLC